MHVYTAAFCYAAAFFGDGGDLRGWFMFVVKKSRKKRHGEKKGQSYESHHNGAITRGVFLMEGGRVVFYAQCQMCVLFFAYLFHSGLFFVILHCKFPPFLNRSCKGGPPKSPSIPKKIYSPLK